jgi:hypothetical protein
LIETEAARARDKDIRITLPEFGAVSTACRSIGQLVNLGFIKVGTGARGGNVFSLADAWQAISSADEAAQLKTLPRPRRARWGQSR